MAVTNADEDDKDEAEVMGMKMHGKLVFRVAIFSDLNTSRKKVITKKKTKQNIGKCLFMMRGTISTKYA